MQVNKVIIMSLTMKEQGKILELLLDKLGLEVKVYEVEKPVKVGPRMMGTEKVRVFEIVGATCRLTTDA